MLLLKIFPAVAASIMSSVQQRMPQPVISVAQRFPTAAPMPMEVCIHRCAVKTKTELPFLPDSNDARHAWPLPDDASP